ncbi:MAG TPA: UDP-N-acetylmuramoyl-L-alanyl-D-glutamate--2,6-diaminopimelate ligase [Candidatus Moranbacteria bacterium]|nr:UDP-N-acetylmuramoyl-L-alanyl-D-glutamate--2,6-diaminopimelate ligase [Candidatus Moranbacteria bacterium]
MQKIKLFVPKKIKNYYHLFQAVLANVFYGFPSKKITVIGVTGTNGKTTTCQMISKILEEAGKKVAMASTINFKLGEKEWVNKTKFTTTSSFSLQKFIKKAVEEKCQYLVLETSSHSLDQYRVWGVDYKTAVITNVTREHLDYHETMDEYRLAKYRLFEKSKVAVVNLEMEKPRDYLLYKIKEKYGYTKKEMDCSKFDCGGIKIVQAENLETATSGSEFEIKGEKFHLNIPGEFNIENALAAISVGISEKISLENMAKSLEKIKIIPGRMESVPNDKNLNIIIDYALTPDSLEKFYGLISQIKNDGRIISVFGSCGDRDRGKRPMMGEIVDKYADFIIVTNEDPYNEDPMQIINEVAAGIKNKKEGENFWRILDRREAIKKALALASAGDFIAVTGKGAEETMMVGTKMIPWNDKKVILEELKNCN